jgi:NAD(P)-dependent dehydrogenase (short-subunit alcohol dehydrogenase family)
MGAGRFDGRSIFITGAGSGFGQRTAVRFAELGAALIHLVDRVPERLEQTAALVTAAGAEAHSHCVDLGEADHCTEVIRRAVALGPRLDVMISNAATFADEHFLDITHESWRRVLAVDLDASFLLAQGAARAMRDTGGGSILFTASIGARFHGRGFTSYDVSKAALLALVRAIAVECAPYNIRANCVSPGPGDTPQSAALVDDATMQRWRTDGFEAAPLQRLASVDDIAEAFVYLASDEARYVTGIDLVVDGGLTAQAYTPPKHTAHTPSPDTGPGH